MSDQHTNKTKHTGGCHCGAVRFEVVLDAAKGSRCNCTICLKSAVTNALTKPEELTVLQGEDNLSTYEWGSRVGQRYFCKTCGIHVFGRGSLEMLGGAYASINMNTLDDVDPRDVKIVYWDGRHNNWQAGPGTEPYPIT